MPDARNQIAFDQAGLGTVLKSYQLEVPTNQREYAWTDVEVSQLFQDLTKAISDGADYFLGTIVTIPRSSGTLEVVDGQQRLATTALLLTAFRDYLKKTGDTMLVEAIDNEFLTGIARRERARVPKLKLNVDDNDLFKAIVTGDAGGQPAATRPSHERLVAAYREAEKHVRKIVSPFDEKDRGDELERWVSFIEHRAMTVLLKVPDDADAYKMFETLNDRGLRTSQADLVKNYLFGKSGSRIGEVQSHWAFMRGALEAIDEEAITITFLRHALVLMKGYLSAPNVYETVQDIAKAEQSAVTLSVQLDTLAPIYVATFNPEHERWNDYPQATRRSIQVFNLLNIKPMQALTLAIAAKMDPREASASFEFLVSLGVRLLISATIRSGSVETPLSTAARDIFDGTITTAAQLKEQLRHMVPSDAVFTEAFERARVSSPKLGRYYLRSLESAAQNVAEPWYVPQDNQTIINLEHILPQKPEGNWPGFTEDDVAQYSKRLGNLVLLNASANSNLKSASFEDKRESYAASPYVLTSQVAEAPDWSTEAIIDRQKGLARLAIKAWPMT